MFSDEELRSLFEEQSLRVLRYNAHDVSLRSLRTGHDWVAVSNYKNPSCYLLHRHSPKYGYHRQAGRYSSLGDAVAYIVKHDQYYIEKLGLATERDVEPETPFSKRSRDPRKARSSKADKKVLQ